MLENEICLLYYYIKIKNSGKYTTKKSDDLLGIFLDRSLPACLDFFLYISLPSVSLSKYILQVNVAFLAEPSHYFLVNKLLS